MRALIVGLSATLLMDVAAGNAFADPPEARDDAVRLIENTPLTVNVFADNGNGADSDADGDPFFMRIGTPERGFPSGGNFGGQHGYNEGAVFGTFGFEPDGRLRLDPSYDGLSAGETATSTFYYTMRSGVTVNTAVQENGQVIELVNFVDLDTHFASIQDVRTELDFNGDARQDFALLVRTNIASEPSARNRLYMIVIVFDPTILADGRLDRTEIDGRNAAVIEFDGTQIYSISTIGDIDADGADDLYFQREFAEETRPGLVRWTDEFLILRGQVGGEPAGVQSLADIRGSRLVTMRNEQTLRQLGRPLLGRGDINNDGIDDFVVPYCLQAAQASTHLGIIYGGSDLPSGDEFLTLISNRGATIELAPSDCKLTGRGTWLTDLDGDGFEDFIQPFGRQSFDGASTIFLGRGQSSNVPDGLSLNGGISSTFGLTFGTRSGLFVESVYSGGDFNNNGRDDLIFSLSGSQGNWPFIILVEPPANIQDWANADLEAVTANGFGFRLRSESDNEQFSHRGPDQVLHDIDGDGFSDLIFNFSEVQSGYGLSGAGILYGRQADLPDVSFANLGSVGADVFYNVFGTIDSSCAFHEFMVSPDMNGDSRSDMIAATGLQLCVLHSPSDRFDASYTRESSSAEVVVTVVGTDDPPRFEDLTFPVYARPGQMTQTVFQSANSGDPDLLERMFVSAVNGESRLVGRWQAMPGGGRYRVDGNGQAHFDVYPAYAGLNAGETLDHAFSVTANSTGGGAVTATITAQITGLLGEPDGRNDLFAAPAGVVLEGDLFADNGNGADVSTGGALRIYDANFMPGGRATLGEPMTLSSGSVITIFEDGQFRYQAPTVANAQTVPDTVRYLIVDENNRRGSATAFFAVEGVNDQRVTITVNANGPPGEEIPFDVTHQSCVGSCSFSRFAVGDISIQTRVTNSTDGRRMDAVRWSGICSAENRSGSVCRFPLEQDETVNIDFEYTGVGPATVYASVLPAARSMTVGGAPATIFATMANSARTEAEGCEVVNSPYFPFAVSFQRTDAANVPVGTPDTRFNIPRGGFQTLVVAFEADAAFDSGDYFPEFRCFNGSVTPIRGVNSVFLSASETPVPDILSIGATPSGDGVIRIADVGGISFLSAAAVNIGAGDAAPAPVDGPAANEATITVTADTGLADLPLTLTVCETGSDGRCLAPRSESVQSQIGDGAKTFAVFVRASSESGVAFDPANARVYLRFTDSGGVVRSVTSAAIVAPSPPAASAAPGVWAMSAATGSRHIESQLIIDTRGRALMSGQGAESLAVSTRATNDFVAIDLTDRAGQVRYSGQVRGTGLQLVDQQDGRVFRGVRSAARPAQLDAGEFALLDGAGRQAGRLTVLANGQLTGEVGACRFAMSARFAELQQSGFSGCDVAPALVSLTRRFDFGTAQYRPALAISDANDAYYWIRPVAD